MTGKRAAPRDPVRTRARLLRVAIEEFSTKGFSGARTLTIARRARCSIRMLYHYFGSKDALYLEVLEHVLGQLRKEELQLDFDALDPMQGLLKMFDFIDRHFGARPELRSLLAFENLDRARHLSRSQRIQQMSSPVIQLIGKLLARGTDAGVFRAGIDPLHLYVSMVSLVYYSKAHAPTLSRIFEVDLSSAAWQNGYRDHVAQMLMAMMAPPAEATDATDATDRTDRTDRTDPMDPTDPMAPPDSPAAAAERGKRTRPGRPSGGRSPSARPRALRTASSS